MASKSTRSLKVYYGYSRPIYKRHPVIRLGGDYLTKAGFKIGDTIVVDFGQERITITKGAEQNKQ